MSPAPRVSPAQAAAIAERYYGVRGRAQRLEAAVDDAFRLVAVDGTSRLLKIGMPGGDVPPAGADTVSLPTGVLLYLSTAAPELPAQRVRPALDSRPEARWADGSQPRLVRMTSWLDGEFIVGRLVTRIIVSRWSAAREPSNQGYLLRRAPLAIEQLAAPRLLSAEKIAGRLRAVRLGAVRLGARGSTVIFARWDSA